MFSLKDNIGCLLVIIVSIYLLSFHPFEWFLLFTSFYLIFYNIRETLSGYKRVKPVHRPAYKRAMRKHFLFCFIISAIPLVFILVHLISFILQQGPFHFFIAYMSAVVAIFFIFSYLHFMAPRIPPKPATKLTPEEFESLIKGLPDRDHIQIQETPDGRYLKKVKQKELVPLSREILLICFLAMIALDISIWFFPERVALLILINLFVAGYLIKKILPPYNKDKKKMLVMPLIGKAFMVTLPLTVGIGIAIFRQGLSLFASSIIALCVQLIIIAMDIFVEPYQHPLLENQSSSDKGFS